MTILSQVSRADAWRVQSQLGPWSMEVPQGQFVPFSCGSNRGIANHKYAVRRALLKPEASATCLTNLSGHPWRPAGSSLP